MITDMNVGAIYDGPPEDNSYLLVVKIKDELEAQLNDTIFSLFPQRKIKETLRRWLWYYYCTVDTDTNKQQSMEVPEWRVTEYDPIAGSLATLNIVAIYKRLLLNLGMLFSFVVFMLGTIFGAATMVLYHGPGTEPLYLVAYFISAIALFICLKCDSLARGLSNRLPIAIFLGLYTLFIIALGVIYS